MPKKNKLSIYLIKETYENNDEAILKGPKNVLGKLDNIGTVYYEPSASKTPKWIDDFYCGEISGQYIFTSNARVVLITRIEVDEKITKTFAITMGYGKNLLENDAVENDFGIKVVLNTISHDNLRKINKTNIGGNHKTSSEQLPLASAIDEFGFDVENDLISGITGLSYDNHLAEGMISGSDMLSLNVEVDITNLETFLKKVYSKYCSKEYRKNFGWVDHIKKIKDEGVIEKLEKKVFELIKEESPSVWMAVPEVIEWEDIAGFKYAKEDLEDDIDISKVIASFNKGFTDFKQLKNKNIKAISNRDGHSSYKEWRAHKCLVGEVEVDGKAYCINNGLWYCIDKDFVKLINEEYSMIPVSDMVFDDCKAGTVFEKDYTADFVKSNPDYMICMDHKEITYGGGRSRIELCDVLTNDGKYIHIKPYSGSSTLSHLFNQAVVSAELVLTDNMFLKKANDKIREITDNNEFLISSEEFSKVKDTTPQAHAYITSITSNFGGKTI